MAERKREETKVRCSLSEKTSWQRQWELDGAESLSDWLRTLANDRVTSAVAALSFAPTSVREPLEPEQLVSGGHERFETPVVLIRDDEHPVPTERRTSTCPCGRPPFLFCGKCDA